jgi:lysophospholipase L1-like esterase
LNALESDPESPSDSSFKSLQAEISEAEVIVFFANPRGDPSQGGVRGGMEKCIGGFRAPDDCTLQLYEPYIENLVSIYEKIFELRKGNPTIIRAVGFYNPIISRHRENGIEIECTQCFEIFNTAIQLAADEFNIPFVSVYDAFNGENRDEDPREKGYIGSDGVHTSEEGQQVIADLLSTAGYEPVKP